MSFIDRLVTWINKKSDKELGATLKAIDNELNATLADIKQLDNEFILQSATGMFLDEHGDWYGFPRKLQETDEAYRARIWKEINRSRLTIPSIREELRNLLPEGSSVNIIEPYKFIFKVSMSNLSDEFLIQDNDYASHGVIDIRINGPINSDIRGLVEELRAAGIKVHISGEYMHYTSIAENVNDNGRSWYEAITELICHRNWQDGFILNHSILGDGGAFPSAGALTWFYPELTVELTIPKFPHSGVLPKIPVQYLDSVAPTFLNNVSDLSGINPVSGISYAMENLYEDIYLDTLFIDVVVELSRDTTPNVRTNFSEYEVETFLPKLNLDAKLLGMDIVKEIEDITPVFTETVTHTLLAGSYIKLRDVATVIINNSYVNPPKVDTEKYVEEVIPVFTETVSITLFSDSQSRISDVGDLSIEDDTYANNLYIQVETEQL